MVVKATAGGGPLPTAPHRPHGGSHPRSDARPQVLGAAGDEPTTRCATGREHLRDARRSSSTATTIRWRLWRRWRSSPALLPNCHGLTVLERRRALHHVHPGRPRSTGSCGDFFRVAAAEPGTGRTTSERRAGEPRSSEAAAETKARPRATSGPLVSDEQWNADRELLDSGLRRVEGFETEIYDHGRGRGGPLRPHPRARRGHLRSAAARLRPRPPRHHLPAPRGDHGAGDHRRPRCRRSARLLDVLGIERAHIVGRGEGAIVASEFALRGAEPHASRWS